MKPDRLNWVLDHLLIVSKTQRKAINHAWDFAVEAHGDQKRKFSGEAYVTHCDEVAAIVAAALADGKPLSRMGEAMICAALMHDTIEDTTVTDEAIADNFGWAIAGLVIHGYIGEDGLEPNVPYCLNDDRKIVKKF